MDVQLFWTTCWKGNLISQEHSWLLQRHLCAWSYTPNIVAKGVLKAGEEADNRRWDGWMASLTRWTLVWASCGDWWWTGKPGMLQSMGLQSVRHNWATELNWTVLDLRHCVRAFSSCGECGLLSSCSAWASHWSSFSCCRAQALGLMGSVVAEHGLSSCAIWA